MHSGPIIGAVKSQEGTNSPRHDRLRPVYTVAGSVAGVLVVWITLIFAVLVNPSVAEPPAHADAIVILGPALDNRLDTATELAHDLNIGALAISVGDTPNQINEGLCATPPTGIHVTCFVPDPYTTRGEAREIGKLAGENGWKNVIVITSPWHISRAHYLVSRCFDGTIQMVAPDDSLGFSDWVQEALYQTGAFLKAFFQRGC